MSNFSIKNIFLKPHMSEKATRLSEKSKQYVFCVKNDFNKKDIAAAVSKHFNVVVKSVSTCNSKGKKKMFKQVIGRQSSYKKAYVTLQDGNSIKLFISD